MKHIKRKSELRAVDIFAGAGGLSLGAEMAGISVGLAVEFNVHAAETFRANHKDALVLRDDIRNIDPLEHTEKHPFILFGGPPCQGFSVANTKTRNLDNENNWMFKEYLRFVEKLEPDWFLFENVEGFKSFDKGRFAVDVENDLRSLGYETNSAVLNAADFGVPQKRNRYFIVGHRLDKGGIKFDFGSLRKKKPVNVMEAISDLPVLSNGDKVMEAEYRCRPLSSYAKFMRKGSRKAKQNIVTENKPHVIDRYSVIGQGQNWQAAKSCGKLENYASTKNTHSGIYRRLIDAEPSVTIANYRKSMLIHPHEHRGLSLREAARLQSFPDTFVFKGSVGSMQQQVGNAVPPLLAKVIFEQITALSYPNS